CNEGCLPARAANAPALPRLNEPQRLVVSLYFAALFRRAPAWQRRARDLRSTTRRDYLAVRNHSRSTSCRLRKIHRLRETLVSRTTVACRRRPRRRTIVRSETRCIQARTLTSTSMSLSAATEALRM